VPRIYLGHGPHAYTTIHRYYHKQTDNPAFKDFWIVIHALHIRALKLIGMQKIEANEVAQKYIEKFKEILGK
jgi:hypothetical protein